MNNLQAEMLFWASVIITGMICLTILFVTGVIKI